MLRAHLEVENPDDSQERTELKKCCDVANKADMLNYLPNSPLKLSGLIFFHMFFPGSQPAIQTILHNALLTSH
jgi:hypothetical protein